MLGKNNNLTLRWIREHNDRAGNNEADMLAKREAKVSLERTYGETLSSDSKN